MTLKLWIASHAVGFGDVPFAVSGSAQWTTEASVVTRRVPGGNVSVTQYLGRGPETVTYDLKFASIDDFVRFKAALGTSAALTLRADMAAIPDRVPVVIGGEAYDRLPDTLLVAIGNEERLFDGIASCSATFQRAVSDVAAPALWMGV